MTGTKRIGLIVNEGIGWGKRSTARGTINWLRKKIDQLKRSDRLKRKIDDW
jgi:hypothetical protein